MKKQHLLAKVFMMLVASAFLLSCNMGSKSSEAATSSEDQAEEMVETVADFQRGMWIRWTFQPSLPDTAFRA
jgi:hypothetical protein